MSNNISAPEPKTLEDFRERCQILDDNLRLLCSRIFELERRCNRLSEPILVENRTGETIFISQIDPEYLAVALTEVLPGGGRLVTVDSRKWEIS